MGPTPGQSGLTGPGVGSSWQYSSKSPLGDSSVHTGLTSLPYTLTDLTQPPPWEQHRPPAAGETFLNTALKNGDSVQTPNPEMQAGQSLGPQLPATSLAPGRRSSSAYLTSTRGGLLHTRALSFQWCAANWPPPSSLSHHPCHLSVYLEISYPLGLQIKLRVLEHPPKYPKSP